MPVRPLPRPWPLIIAIVAVLPLLGWWATGLFDLDEGFYAAVTGEMLRRGDWITPYYNGQPWFEKPILLYWASAPWIALMGTDFGPRFSSVLATLALYAAMFWGGRRYVGDRPAALAVLVLASSLLSVGVGRLMMTDALLVGCMVAAWGCLFASFEPDSEAQRGWLRAASGALLGFGVLAKGPVALLLTGLIGTVYLLRVRDIRPNGRGVFSWIGFAVLFAIVVGLWYGPAYAANGQVFVQKFLIEQNVGRFTGGDAAHTMRGIAGYVFYLPIFLVGFFPWSLLSIPAWRGRPKGDGSEVRFLRFNAIVAGTVLVFFTVSSAKLMHYIQPALPALAMLIGGWLDRRWPTGSRPLAAAAGWCVAVSLLVNVGLAAWYRISGHAEVHALVRWARAQGGPGAVYRLPRERADRGTGGTQLQETSHPSLIFYWRQTLAQPTTLEELQALPRPIWVITRKNRISRKDIEMLAAKGVTVETSAGIREDRYRLVRLVSMRRSPASVPRVP